MTDGEDDDENEVEKKNKLKLVTEFSSDGGDDSGSNNVVSLGYFGDESENSDEDEETAKVLSFASHKGDSVVPSAITYELLREDIIKIMAVLNPRERSILELRFGLEDGKTRTLEEVASLIGTTRERIRQIETKALKKLRHPNRSRGGEPADFKEPKPTLSWQEIEDKLSRFKSLDRRIIKMLWGFIDGERRTKEKVAQKFDVSYEYVCQLEVEVQKLFEF